MKDIEKQINLYVLYRAGWRCERCGDRATEVAHRIANTKVNNKKYGKDVIMHANNKRASCHGCNDYFNIGNKPVQAEELVKIIREELDA